MFLLDKLDQACYFNKCLYYYLMQYLITSKISRNDSDRNSGREVDFLYQWTLSSYEVDG